MGNPRPPAVCYFGAARFGLRFAVVNPGARTISPPAGIALFAVWGTVRGPGLLPGFSLQESILLLQAYLGTVAVTTLAISAVTSERKKDVETLRSVHDELESRVRKRTAGLSVANDSLKKRATLLELARDAIVVCDLNYTILFWNPGTERTYGWSREEGLGKPAPESTIQRGKRSSAWASAG